ncbi:uncharacterized protein UTRI_00751_B [Ustilago trichophora]|uniref:Uncharacterized protein n=1 Tax=Ustilago trichophora TaxID=86804 RepID=A0A5C3DQ27_9BASI|nr:uncharacterized protein UTRI_00751_B [Ustilago trichophora]
MKLLPAFSTLLLALQLVGAVQMDQLQRSGFVKAKRTISQDGPRAERFQPNLQRRAGEELVLSLDSAIEHIRTLAGSSEHAAHGNAVLADLERIKQKLVNPAAPGYGGHPPYPYAGGYHYPPPQGVETGAHNRPAPQGPWYETIQAANLEKMTNAEVRKHGKNIDLLIKHSAEQDQDLKKVSEYLAETSKRMKKSDRDIRLLKMSNMAGLGATTLASGASILIHNDANNRLNDQQEQLNRANAELAKLRSGQQPGYSGGQAVQGRGGLV